MFVERKKSFENYKICLYVIFYKSFFSDRELKLCKFLKKKLQREKDPKAI